MPGKYERNIIELGGSLLINIPMPVVRYHKLKKGETLELNDTDGNLTITLPRRTE